MSSEISIQQQVDRFMQGAGDALTDDTVARLGFMMNELLIIADSTYICTMQVVAASS